MTSKINIQEYEFNDTETEVISELSTHMQFIGAFLRVFGLLYVLGGLLSWGLDKDLLSCLIGVIEGILIFFAALWTINAATSFRTIVKGRGNDMKNLLTGFEEVKRVYGIQVLILIFPTIIFIGYFVVVVVLLSISS